MKWAISDFRRYAGVWTGTFLTLFVAMAACVATVLSRSSAETLLAAAETHRSADLIEPGCDLAWKATLVFVFLTVPPVLNAGISQRRRDLALLSLQGASPMEMLSRTELQMLVLLVPACVLGSLVGFLCAPFLFAAADSAFSQHLPYTPTDVWQSMALSCLLCALVVLASTL